MALRSPCGNLDPYMHTDGPGWRCDVCHYKGAGLVYHSSTFDIDICLKCMNMARKLDWVEHIDNAAAEMRSQNQTKVDTSALKDTTSQNRNASESAQKVPDKSITTTSLPESSLSLNLATINNADGDGTWSTIGRPDDPASPVQVAHVFSPTDEHSPEELPQRDEILFRGAVRSGGSANHHGEIVMLTVHTHQTVLYSQTIQEITSG